MYIKLYFKNFLHTHTHTRARARAHKYRRTQGDYSSAKILNVLLQVRNTISISWQKKKWIHSACLMIMILLCITQRIPFRKVLIWTQSYLWKPMEKRDPRSDKELDWVKAILHKRIFCTNVTVRICSYALFVE